MRLSRWFALVVAAVLIAACAKPLPADKQTYAGEWKAPGMYLLILADGSCSYKRIEQGVTKSINASVKEFQGDNFVVGLGPISTTFNVSAPPHQDGGTWKMTVDGVELVKTP